MDFARAKVLFDCNRRWYSTLRNILTKRGNRFYSVFIFANSERFKFNLEVLSNNQQTNEIWNGRPVDINNALLKFISRLIRQQHAHL